MDNINEKVNHDWLLRTTGDPFVDCGGIVIKHLFKEFPEKNIFELIEFITKIYVKNWNAGLNAFFLNSKITQPAFKGERKILETVKYFESLFEDTLEYKNGFCRVIGVKTNLFFAGRDNFILSGSGTFINFHHFHEEGLFVSKEVIIRMYFIPFGVMYLGNKVALLQSNNSLVIDYFVKKNCKKNLKELSINLKSGINKSEHHNPTNALFEFANECIRNVKRISENEKEIIINLYHFTNFGASADIMLYVFPATLFKFYKYCLSKNLKKDWKNFVAVHYRSSKHKDAKYNLTSEKIESVKKKIKEDIEFDSYKKWYNIIYSNLIDGKSILPNIVRYSKENKFSFIIVIFYQKIIRDMETKTLNKIEELAEFIIQDEDKLRKNITRLNGIKKNYELRSFLLSMIKKNYESGEEKPLITLLEYVEYLFPDGSYWAEIRDLLLIAIYQKLHEKKIIIEVPKEDTIIEE